MILFIETYSIIQTLFLLKHIRKADRIYFHKSSVPSLPDNPRVRMFVERLIRLFNSKVSIETLPARKINEHNWVTNKMAVDFVEAMTPDIENSASYQTISRIIGDKNIITSYKARLAEVVSARLLFFRVARDLIEESGVQCYLAPADNQNSEIQKKSVGEETLDRFILRGGFRANHVRNFFRKIYAIVILLLLPTAYAVVQFRRVTFKKIDRKSYDMAIPVIWGFHDGDIIISGVRWKQDDGYLYSDKIKLGRIVHIFNLWRDSPEVESKYKRIMDEKGVPYIDEKSFRINAKLLSTYAKIQFKIILYFLPSLFYCRDQYNYIRYSDTIIFIMLNKFLELENVDYGVELIRHDYSPMHVIETILCNQKGKKTVGIQHGSTAGPYVENKLCYVHLDRYCIFSDRHLELHAPFWSRLHLEKAGNPRVDHLVELANNPSLLAPIENRLIELHGQKPYTVLIVFPNPNEYSLIEKWDEIYAALCELRAIEIDCNVFMRFRRSEQLENSHLTRFKELTSMDSRFIIDLINFTTYELMAVSDLVITSSHSSGMIDAVSMDKKAFTFDYMGTAKYCFARYGKDIILNTKDDVLKLFNDLENNFTGYDCDWDLLKKEYNYYYDGLCSERFQNAMLETVEEARRRN